MSVSFLSFTIYIYFFFFSLIINFTLNNHTVDNNFCLSTRRVSTRLLHSCSKYKKKKSNNLARQLIRNDSF